MQSTGRKTWKMSPYFVIQLLNGMKLSKWWQKLMWVSYFFKGWKMMWKNWNGLSNSQIHFKDPNVTNITFTCQWMRTTAVTKRYGLLFCKGFIFDRICTWFTRMKIKVEAVLLPWWRIFSYIWTVCVCVWIRSKAGLAVVKRQSGQCQLRGRCVRAQTLT